MNVVYRIRYIYQYVYTYWKVLALYVKNSLLTLVMQVQKPQMAGRFVYRCWPGPSLPLGDCLGAPQKKGEQIHGFFTKVIQIIFINYLFYKNILEEKKTEAQIFIYQGGVLFILPRSNIGGQAGPFTYQNTDTNLWVFFSLEKRVH